MQQLDVENKGVMDFDDFSVFIRQLRLRPEITRLFKKYATSNSAYLSPEEFLKFMHKQQKVQSRFSFHSCVLTFFLLG